LKLLSSIYFGHVLPFGAIVKINAPQALSSSIFSFFIVVIISLPPETGLSASST